MDYVIEKLESSNNNKIGSQINMALEMSSVSYKKHQDVE